MSSAGSPGRSMRHPEPPARDDTPVLVCDLDGTILRVNSFPFWLLHLIGGRLPGITPGARVRLSLRAQLLLLRRKIGGMDHQVLMGAVQEAWHQAVRGDYAPADHFSARLLRWTRP